MNIALILLISYLVGNISPSYFLGKEYKHIDIREHGSGNAGSTNALRVMGKKIALCVFLVDFFKGFFVAFFVNKYFGGLQNALYASLAVVIGHIYPVILGFRGGKGVATSLGVLYCLFTKEIIICSVIGLIILAAKKYVSLASMSTLFMINIALLIAGYPIKNVAVVFVIFLIVIFKHRSNIKRLINHEERKIGEKAN